MTPPTTNPTREPMNHSLKTDPAVFDDVKAGKKGFEIRYNDRDFRVGDTLTLQRTEFTGKQMASEGEPLIFTGETEVRTVTHILHGPIYGLEKGWCIMSITPPSPQPNPSIAKAAEGASKEVAMELDKVFEMIGGSCDEQFQAHFSCEVQKLLTRHLAPVQKELDEAREIIKARAIFHRDGHGKKCIGCKSDAWLARNGVGL